MKKLKRTLAVIITAAMILASFATTAFAAPQTGTTDDGFIWTETGDGSGFVKITGVDTSKFNGGSVNIPSALGGMEVVEIAGDSGKGAFQDIDTITDIKIPDTVTAIDGNAFYGCDGLTDVTLGAGLQTIGDNAFAKTALNSITIPANVTAIGKDAFSECGSLSSVKFAAASKLTTIGEAAFYKSAVTSVTIPASVTEINPSAFSDTPLNKVVFAEPSNLSKIHTAAFKNTRLANVTIPSSVTLIESDAFNNATLTSVVFNTDTVTINDGAFSATNINKNYGMFYTNTKSTADTYAQKDTSNKIKVIALDLAVGTPEITSAESTSNTSVFVSWSAASFKGDTNLYTVYYKVYYAKSLADLGTTSGSSTTVKKLTYTTLGSLTDSATYYIKVVAYCEKVEGANTYDYYGDFSDVVTAAPKLKAPTSISVKQASYSSVTVSWSAVSGAAGYKIFRSTSLYGTYTPVKSVTGTTVYTDTKLTAGTTYYYKVSAYVTTTAVGDSTRAVSITPSLPKVTGLSVTTTKYATKLLLKWTAVAGRSGYEIRRSMDPNAPINDWSLIKKNATSTTFTDINLATGTKYYYIVTAYRTVSKVKGYAPASDQASGIPGLAKVTGAKAVASGTSKIKVSWKAVTSRKYYQIQRMADGVDSTWVNYKTITGTSFYDIGLDAGKKYSYRICACRIPDPTDTDNIVSGDWSDTVYATTTAS